MDDRTNLRAALLHLGESLSDIVTTAEAKSRERCPYKTTASLCAFRGGCQNQRPGRTCAGDHVLVWDPAR